MLNGLMIKEDTVDAEAFSRKSALAHYDVSTLCAGSGQ